MLRLSPFWKFTVAIGGTVLVGMLSGVATATSVDSWYPTLHKPFFNPPNWVFAPVWTILYVLIGIAAGMVWNSNAKEQQVQKAMRCYIVQLVLNAAWSILFFALRSPTLALLDIIALWVAIVWCMRAFRPVNATAANMLSPYIAWVSFAALLNIAIVTLN